MAAEVAEEEAQSSARLANQPEREVRKLRKKLRQIERLEAADWTLNDEEARKVEVKDELRSRLTSALAMKRKSADGEGVTAKRRAEGVNEANESSASLGQEEQLEISRSASGEDVQVPETSSSSLTISNGDERVRVSLTSPSDGRAGRTLKKGDVSRKLKALAEKAVVIKELAGHEDLTLAADCDENFVLTAGRDTTVLVWHPSSGEQPLFSLRGHSGPVTAVLLLPSVANRAISASLDCSLKIWDLTRGALVRDIYTFNGVKCICLLPLKTGGTVVATGTDGGKLEAFDVGDVAAGSSSALFSLKDAHDDAVTAVDACMDANGDCRLAAGSRDGSIKIFAVDVKEKKWDVTLASAAVDAEAAEEDHVAHVRCVLSLKFLPSPSRPLVYGDAGHNLKVLDWLQAKIHKLPNHESEEGSFADGFALIVYSQAQVGHGGVALLAASGYDVTSGVGHVNFFLCDGSSSLPEYLCTWRDEKAGRALDIAACADRGVLTLVSAGRRPRLWRAGCAPPANRDAIVLWPQRLARPRETVDSGSSEDDETDDDQTHGRRPDSNARGRSQPAQLATEGAGWRCAIL